MRLDAGPFQALANMWIRPVRIAYLIKAGSREQFLEAVERATTRWGGQTEPILVLNEAGQLSAMDEIILRIARPHALLNLSAERPTTSTNDLSRRLAIPLTDRPREDQGRVGVGQLAVLEVSENPIHWPLPQSLSPVMAAGVGNDRRLGDLLIPLRIASKVSSNADCVIGQLSRGTAIGATTKHVADPRGTANPSPAVLWIADAESLDDAIAFWNLRALMPLSPEPPFAVIGDVESLEQEVIGARLRQALARMWNSTPDLFIYSLSVGTAVLADIREKLGLKPFDEGKVNFRLNRSLSSPIQGRSMCASVDIDPRQCIDDRPQLFGARTSELVQSDGKTVPLHFHCPIAFSTWGGRIQAGVSGIPHLEAPQRQSVAALFCTSDWAGPGEIEISTTAIAEYYFHLNVPTSDGILRAALSERNIGFTVSTPGYLAPVLEDRLGSVEAMRQKQMIETIRALTTPRRVQLERALTKLGIPEVLNDATIQDLLQTFGVRQRKALTAEEIAKNKRIDRVTVGTNLALLTKADLATRGVLITCPVCKMNTFVAVQQMVARPSCPACDASVRYAASEIGEPVFYYQLDGVLDLASDLGVLPHLAVYQTLVNQWPGSYLIMGAELQERDQRFGEIDILGVNRYSVVGGEVKPTGAEFTEEQLTKDLAKSKRATADMHVMGCLEVLPDRTKETARRLANEYKVGIHIIDYNDIWPTTPSVL